MMNAGQFGFSGNAQQVDQEVTNNQFEASMANFTDYHWITKSVVSNLTDTNSRLTSYITQLHQQMQMMQLMMQHNINNSAQNNLGNNGGNKNNSNNSCCRWHCCGCWGGRVCGSNSSYCY